MCTLTVYFVGLLAPLGANAPPYSVTASETERSIWPEFFESIDYLKIDYNRANLCRLFSSWKLLLVNFFFMKLIAILFYLHESFMLIFFLWNMFHIDFCLRETCFTLFSLLMKLVARWFFFHNTSWMLIISWWNLLYVNFSSWNLLYF